MKSEEKNCKIDTPEVAAPFYFTYLSHRLNWDIPWEYGPPWDKDSENPLGSAQRRRHILQCCKVSGVPILQLLVYIA